MEMWRNQFQKFQHVVDTHKSARSDLAREVIFTLGDNHVKEQMVRTWKFSLLADLYWLEIVLQW